MNPSRIAFLALLVLAPMLSGCIAVAATGAIAGISAIRQERSIGNAIDDTRIKTMLDVRLAQRAFAASLAVSTSVVEGRVVLAGQVDTAEKRLDASRVAWSIEGVIKVDNDIDVTDRFGWLDRPFDLLKRTQLAATLLADNEIKDVNYTTDVVHGVVYLMGVAQDQAEMNRVVAHAQGIYGVQRVENYVVLKGDPVRYGLGALSSR